MVFAGLKGKRRYVNGDVKHPEESEGQHGRDALSDRFPLNQIELYMEISQSPL